jgi:hypothetical protein
MSSFNLDSYTALLADAKNAGYDFISFDKVGKLEEPFAIYDNHSLSKSKINNTSYTEKRGQCILRHDIDADLAAAATMARIEYKLGIHATYFLMWRSPCYNLMSRSSQILAESILMLGHHIGLHYDQGFDAKRNRTAAETAQQVQQQADWLQILLGSPVHAVSFHQPSSALLQSGMDCGERINTYDHERLKHFRYISDSNRVFSLWQSDQSQQSDNDPTQALEQCYPQNIQLLIHPMWWVYDDPSTEAVWDRALMSNFLQTQVQLLETERAFGPRREVIINRLDWPD